VVVGYFHLETAGDRGLVSLWKAYEQRRAERAA